MDALWIRASACVCAFAISSLAASRASATPADPKAPPKAPTVTAPATKPAKPPTLAETANQARMAEEKADKVTEDVAEVAKKVDANEKTLDELQKAAEKKAADAAIAEQRKTDEAALGKQVESAKESAKNAELAAAAGKLKDASAAAEKAASAAEAAQALAAKIAASKDAGAAAAAAQEKADSATTAAKSASEKVDAKKETVCGKGRDTPYPCFYAGAFVSSASVAVVYADGSHGGETSHALVAAVIPTIGMRLPLDQQQRFSIDVGALSMLVSKDLSQTTSSHAGCRTTNGNFENKLPCEGNAALIPWVAGYVGLTVSASDIGLLTVMPMFGAASTSLDGNVYPFFGLSVGLISLTKTIQ